MSWSKLDYSLLEQDKKDFRGQLRKFKNTKRQNLLKKLKDYIEEFIKMCPLIEKLKSNPNFKETHWERLISDIKQDPSQINIKFLTL